jgi:hypothetical protein
MDISTSATIDPHFSRNVSKSFAHLIEKELKIDEFRNQREQRIDNRPPLFEFTPFRLPREPLLPQFPKPLHIEGFQETPNSTERNVRQKARPKDFAIETITQLKQPSLTREFARFPIAKLVERMKLK